MLEARPRGGFCLIKVYRGWYKVSSPAAGSRSAGAGEGETSLERPRRRVGTGGFVLRSLGLD